jgi:hypothetical protein
MLSNRNRRHKSLHNAGPCLKLYSRPIAQDIFNLMFHHHIHNTRHWTLLWARRIKFTDPTTGFLRSVKLLHCHLRVDPTVYTRIFPWRFTRYSVVGCAIKKNTQTLIDASKEVGLEVNTEKAKYMLLSRHQNAEQNHDIKIGNRSFKNVAQFR